MTLTKGLWLFKDYELAMVKQTKPFLSITTGFFEMSGSMEDQCKPLTIENKRISDQYHDCSTRIHRLGHNGLNYPDIHRWLVKEWAAACDACAAGEKLDAYYDRLRKFEHDILSHRDADSGYGFPINRPGARS